MEYIKVKTKEAVLILTTEEYEQGIDRQNYGVEGRLFEEKEYNDTDYLKEKSKGTGEKDERI